MSSRGGMSTRVFVGGLTYKVRERDLEKFFRNYGRIREISMKNGFAFVEFDDYRDAEDAVYEANGKELLGEVVTVERARGMPRGSDRWKDRFSSSSRSYSSRSYRDRDRDRDGGRSYRPSRQTYTRTDYQLTVENLSSRCNWHQLKDMMQKAGGEVTYADAHRDAPNEGIVEFVSYDDMKRAIEKLNGTELNGRKLRITETGRGSKRNNNKSASRSRSNSPPQRRQQQDHSRSRSRSIDNNKSRSENHSRSGSEAKENDDN